MYAIIGKLTGIFCGLFLPEALYFRGKYLEKS